MVDLIKTKLLVLDSSGTSPLRMTGSTGLSQVIGNSEGRKSVHKDVLIDILRSATIIASVDMTLANDYSAYVILNAIAEESRTKADN